VPYRLGDDDLDARIAALTADAGADAATADLAQEMIVTALKMLRDGATRGDMKLTNASLKEMRYAFRIFSRYRHIKKTTVFGSARTPADEPNYRMAADFGRLMADDRRWMVVTGAGPGIMEAANQGAGRKHSFGVNIRLPFEDQANEFIDEHRVINFKYFFTRKLMFMKESHAFALFPGGFGTLDESFELLTLIQTGKSDMHPIVLMEAPGTDYWRGWLSFVEGTLVERGMIRPADLDLFTHTTDITEAADEICHFYDNYHSQRFVNGDLILRLLHTPDEDLMAEINDEFPDVLSEGRFEAITATSDEIADDDVPELPRIRFRFDRRSFGRLRRLIDRLNDSVSD